MRSKRSIGIWILSGLLAAEFLLAGGMKLAGAEPIAEQFEGFWSAPFKRDRRNQDTFH